MHKISSEKRLTDLRSEQRLTVARACLSLLHTTFFDLEGLGVMFSTAPDWDAQLSPKVRDRIEKEHLVAAKLVHQEVQVFMEFCKSLGSFVGDEYGLSMGRGMKHIITPDEARVYETFGENGLMPYAESLLRTPLDTSEVFGCAATASAFLLPASWRVEAPQPSLRDTVKDSMRYFALYIDQVNPHVLAPTAKLLAPLGSIGAQNDV